jgi:hypothetical protein
LPVRVKKMGVEFNEHQPLGYNYQPKKGGGISGLVIKMGLAKDEAGAKKVMVAVIIICFALSIYFFVKI